MNKNNHRKSGRKTRKNKYNRVMMPPKSINNYITHIIYINLDKRLDRKERIEKQLSVFEPSKITRIPGVIHKNPAIGCAIAHIQALKMAKKHGWPNVLILEDDSVWSNVSKSYPIFVKLVNQPYDVIMLGGTYPRWYEKSYRVNHALSACAYLVHHSYYDKLIETVEHGLHTRNSSGHNIAVNVSFTKLQPTDNWLLIRPALMIQAKSYSNILGSVVDYRGFF